MNGSSQTGPIAFSDDWTLSEGFYAYLSHRDYDRDLLVEIGDPAYSLPPQDALTGRLHLQKGPLRPAAWAQNIWLESELIAYVSIADAARKLRAVQRNWIYCPVGDLRRRAALIEQALPPISRKPRPFPFDMPSSPMGAFCLIDKNRMLASRVTSSPFADGVVEFVENKIDPPSRAYLKLWEALSLLDRRPGRGDRCLDAGACPGGWTWVLLNLGAHVIAVDRAALDARLMGHPELQFLQHSVFTLKPSDVGPVDWLFSDVICYPPKLLEWIESWLASGLCRNFVCTVKMQGEPDWETMQRLRAIPGSRLVHLWHNKHELTWMLCTPTD